MCGINGFLQFDNKFKTNEIEKIIKKMNKSIISRGPDDEGIYINKNIGLGMRRLSIIDLKTGNQPIFNEDGSMVIIFNGELYNYKDLKIDLINKGHLFKTTTDTEVVLHAYEEYGEKSFNFIKGMYAFSIYDINEEKLLIVRDRLGEKPLYFYKDENKFMFSSELKGILATNLINKEIDKNALSHFFQLTYIPAPNTILKNIKKLKPGYYIEIKMENYFNISINQYWDLEFNNSKLIYDFEKIKKNLREKMFEAVEKCMISDVPLGAFLSGGIDSSIIVGIMSKISSTPIKTFNIGFQEKQFDESERAKIVSKFNKTEHYTKILTEKDLLDLLDDFFEYMDEPFADDSAIPTYLVSKYAKNYVKVVLTGDGGDEIFGGYSKYLINYYSEKYNKIPKLIREKIIKNIINYFSNNYNITRKLKKVIRNSEKSIFEQRKELIKLGYTYSGTKELIKSDTISDVSLIEDYYEKYKNQTDELSQTLYTDIKMVLEGDMLAKVDRMSMANSLETRAPFLYPDIIEFSTKIPSQYKIQNKKTKFILKETFSDILPKKIISASKRGFGIPIGKWFRGDLKNEFLNVTNRKFIENQNLFNYEYIQKIFNEHQNKKENRGRELWTLFVFQKWYKKYFE
jgi:asparagine synthase (glutamine-hydrolysing)